MTYAMVAPLAIMDYLVKNLVSASQQPKVIDVTLAKECELRRILRPSENPPVPNFLHIWTRLSTLAQWREVDNLSPISSP